MDSIETNPWAGKNLDDFVYFCCPECDEKDQSKEAFLQHALENHPKFKEFYPEYAVKQEIFEGDDYISEIPNNKENKYDIEAKMKQSDDYVKNELVESVEVKCEVQPMDDNENDFSEFNEYHEGISNVIGDETFENTHEGKCPCHICGKNFWSAKYLKEHISAVHEKIKDKKCHLCDKVYGFTSDLNKHIKNVHEGFRHTCHICYKEFSEKKSLNSHIKSVHDGEKNYKCDTCGKNFSYRQNLKDHIEWVHEGIKKHFCKICERNFGSSSSLKNHNKTVHENIRYNCEYCEKSFTATSSLNNHINQAHNKAFSCSTCEKGFQSAKLLQEHIDFVHEGIVNYRCELCGKAMENERTLKSHLKSTHKGVKCGECVGCAKIDDCGECKYCLNKSRFGTCRLKVCVNRHNMEKLKANMGSSTDVKSHSCTYCGTIFEGENDIINHVTMGCSFFK